MSTSKFISPKKGASLYMPSFGTIFFVAYLSDTDEVMYTDSKTSRYYQRVASNKVQHRKTNSPKHYAKYL